MAHRNARLTEFGRLLLVQRITELGWPVPAAAEAFGVSRATCYKWLGRWRTDGIAGLQDRASRPHRRPHALGVAAEHRILAARDALRQGPTSWPATWVWPAPPSTGAAPPRPLPAW